MDYYRIVNFITQSVYLLGHLLFILSLYRKRQPTPIWFWFFIVSVSLWVWVSGRFMETIVYLFFPTNNDAYVFAANYQYLGNTTAVVSYVIWILFLSGHDKLASSKWFQAFLFASPVVTCLFVFTNGSHQLFYTKLMMGEQVAHGPLFAPLLAWSYLILLAGYIVSIASILRTGYDKGKRLVMFSLFPVLPALAILVRSFTGVDRLDYTPMIMAVAIYSLYQIVFKLHYVNIISASIGSVLEQTAHPIGIYDSIRKEMVYSNQIAKDRYESAVHDISQFLLEGKKHFEGRFEGKSLIVDAVPLVDGKSILVTATDTSEIAEQQASLDAQIEEMEALNCSLEEENRNIDAYLDSLYDVEGLKRKQELIAETYQMIYRVFGKIETNIKTAKQSSNAAEAALRDNLALSKDCITKVRETVARLREG